MLELLFDRATECGHEAETVNHFCDLFIDEDDAESLFFSAIRDTKFIGFKAGFAVAMSIFHNLDNKILS